MKKIIAAMFLVGVFWFGNARAEGLPSVGLAVDKSQIKPGENITYTIDYGNSSTEDLSDVVVSLDLDVSNGINFVGSSLPQFWNGSKPYWKLSSLPKDTSSAITITLNVAEDYTGESLSGIAELSGDGNDGLVSVASNSTAVSLVTTEDTTEEPKTDEEKKEEDTKKDEVKKEEPKEAEKELTADGLKSIKVDNVVGGANLANYSENINKWDNRFLLVGLICFSLVLIIGIGAFVLGRKVR